MRMFWWGMRGKIFECAIFFVTRVPPYHLGTVQNNQSCGIFCTPPFSTHFHPPNHGFSSFRPEIDDSEDEKHEIDHEICVDRLLNEIRSENNRSG